MPLRSKEELKASSSLDHMAPSVGGILHFQHHGCDVRTDWGSWGDFKDTFLWSSSSLGMCRMFFLGSQFTPLVLCSPRSVAPSLGVWSVWGHLQYVGEHTILVALRLASCFWLVRVPKVPSSPKVKRLFEWVSDFFGNLIFSTVIASNLYTSNWSHA